jgi:hypothetical protein
LPLVGYIPFLKNHDAKPYKALIKLSQIYGPVTGFYMGPSFTVSVCGYEAVVEALHNEDLNGRPDSAARRERTFGKRLGELFIRKLKCWQGSGREKKKKNLNFIFC